MKAFKKMKAFRGVHHTGEEAEELKGEITPLITVEIGLHKEMQRVEDVPEGLRLKTPTTSDVSFEEGFVHITEMLEIPDDEKRAYIDEIGEKVNELQRYVGEIAAEMFMITAARGVLSGNPEDMFSLAVYEEIMRNREERGFDKKCESYRDDSKLA